jgi:hypothetical protein
MDGLHGVEYELKKKVRKRRAFIAESSRTHTLSLGSLMYAKAQQIGGHAVVANVRVEKETGK